MVISLKKLDKTAGGSWGPPGGLEHGKSSKSLILDLRVPFSGGWIFSEKKCFFELNHDSAS